MWDGPGGPPLPHLAWRKTRRFPSVYCAHADRDQPEQPPRRRSRASSSTGCGTGPEGVGLHLEKQSELLPQSRCCRFAASGRSRRGFAGAPFLRSPDAPKILLAPAPVRHIHYTDLLLDSLSGRNRHEPVNFRPTFMPWPRPEPREDAGRVPALRVQPEAYSCTLRAADAGTRGRRPRVGRRAATGIGHGARRSGWSFD